MFSNLALYQVSQLWKEKTFLSRKNDGFLLFSNLLACPAGAISDGTAPCACAANFQLNDAADACVCAANFQLNDANDACEG